MEEAFEAAKKAALKINKYGFQICMTADIITKKFILKILYYKFIRKF